MSEDMGAYTCLHLYFRKIKNDPVAREERKEKMEESKKLKFGDLFAIGLGVCVGAAVFSLTGPAAVYTGGSAFLAYILAALALIFMVLPYIIAGSVVPRQGLSYVLCKEGISRGAGGFLFYIKILGCIGIVGNCTSFAVYFTSVFTTLNPNIVGAVVIILFYITNWFGLKNSAKVQTIMNLVMLLAFGSFIIAGFIHMDTVFVFNEERFLAGGMSGLISAVSLLVFCMSGALGIMELGGEIENPEKNLPKAFFAIAIIASLGFACIALVSVGALPMGDEQTVGTFLYNGPANSVMNAAAAIFANMKPLQYFFVFGGACLAVATTINGCYPVYGATVKPASDDGWFPKWFAQTNKHGTQYRIMFVFLLVGLIPLILLDPNGVSSVNTNVMKVYSNLSILGLIIPNLGLLAYPKLYPEIWKKSKWHMNKTMLRIVVIVPTLFGLFLWWNNLQGLTPGFKIAVIIAVLVGIAYAAIGCKTFARQK